MAYPPRTFARTITEVMGLISGYDPASGEQGNHRS